MTYPVGSNLLGVKSSIERRPLRNIPARVTRATVREMEQANEIEQKVVDGCVEAVEQFEKAIKNIQATLVGTRRVIKPSTPNWDRLSESHTKFLQLIARETPRHCYSGFQPIFDGGADPRGPMEPEIRQHDDRVGMIVQEESWESENDLATVESSDSSDEGETEPRFRTPPISREKTPIDRRDLRRTWNEWKLVDGRLHPRSPEEMAEGPSNLFR